MASDEDYIDMEVSSTSSLYSPSPSPREFEFPGSLVDKERTTISPADELFYKGNLLPLHIPPRLQMVEKLLQNISIFEYDTTTFNTPLDSPSESCRVSRELSPDECFFECEAAEAEDEGHALVPKKFWSKKMKLIKHSHKLIKASRAYVRSLFIKSGCSDQSCCVGTKEAQQATVTIAKECLNKYIKASKKNPFPFGQISSSRKEKKTIKEEEHSHRRSFSGVIKQQQQPNKLSSSSSLSNSSSSSCSSFSSSNSNGLFEVHLLKRSSSANSDIESSVQGAIAHCKMSHFSGFQKCRV